MNNLVLNFSTISIGFILDQYHTELLDFLFEIYIDFNIILYIDNDNYNNIPLLKQKHKFSIFPISKIGSSPICIKYIVLSHTTFFFNTFSKINHKNIIYLIHTLPELNLCKKYSHFVVSKVVDEIGNYVIPIAKKTISNISFQDTQNLNVIKIGWVTGDISMYTTILNSTQIKLHIFTTSDTPLLIELKQKYGNQLVVHYAKSSDFINTYINNNKIKFVFYNPPNIDLWSGSIAFALNNNLILLTNKNVIDLYKIPYDNYICCHNADFIQQMLNKKLKNDSLIEYKNEIFNTNSRIFKSLITY